MKQLKMPNQINPSEDFAKKVLDQVYRLSLRQQRIAKIITISIAFLPLAMRQIWLMVRNDYFSLSNLPFSSALTQTYTVLISPIGGYLIMISSLVIIYLLSNSKNYRRLSFN